MINVEALRRQLLTLAMHGKLVPQNPNDEPATALLKKIAIQKQQLIANKSIKKSKPLPPITPDEIPYKIPDNWCWTRLGEIIQTNIGLTYKPEDISNNENGIPVLNAKNVQNEQLDLLKLVKINTNFKIAPNKLLTNNSILISVRNSPKLVGKSAIIDENIIKKYEKLSFGAFMAVIRPIKINVNFIHSFLKSSIFKNQIRKKRNKTVSSSMSQITQGMLNNIIIPIPPFIEQERIVNKLNEILK